MYPKFNYSGYGLFERIRIRKNLKKYNFVTISIFPEKETVINQNIIFIGNHEGNIKVSLNSYFIFRGKLIGDMLISEGAKIDFFGKINGVLKSEEELHLRKEATVIGEIITRKLKVEDGSKITGKITLLHKADKPLL